MRKLLLVYNPRSSHHAAVEREVLVAARGLSGWMVGKYEIKPTNFNANVKELSRLLSDGDLLVALGGDGTATIAMNSILLSGKDVAVSVLGYGNFNDIANLCGERRPKIGKAAENLARIVERFSRGEMFALHPIEVKVNNGHWRYAPCYATAGMLAEATKILEEPQVRKKLKTGHESVWFSLRMAVKWYLKNHRRKFLPECTLNGQKVSLAATDYLVVNGPTLAEIMKGGDWWKDARDFGSSVQELGKFWKMVKFGWRSVRKGVPLQETQGDMIEFAQPSAVEMHVEGEYERLEEVKTLEVKKAAGILKIVGNE